MTRVAIVGVGLIGGSLGLALKQAGFASHVVGCGRGAENLRVALERGCIDSFTHDPAEAVAGADLVVLAVPVASTAAVCAAIAPRLASGAVVTDVGSVKQPVLAAANAVLPAGSFVGGHPIAGTENSGAAAAFAELFRGKRWVLTPDAATSPTALARVHAMAAATGARVEHMRAADHDRIFAWVSHLPHVLAYALAEAMGATDPELMRFGGGGLSEFLRIAASDAVMWRDILHHNRSEVRRALAVFRVHLEALDDALDDPSALEARLAGVRAAVRAVRDHQRGDRA